MAVSINWGMLLMGVLMIRDRLLGIRIGAVIFGNSHMGIIIGCYMVCSLP